jgi:lipopolysaccharide biosynthesis protein
MLEFPPHGTLEHGLTPKFLNCFVNPYFTGNVWDAKDYVKQKKYLYDVEFKLFKGVCPSWDNTPRKAYSNGSVLDDLTPEVYEDWLSNCIDYTRMNHPKNERFIFINAWNEWAEGAHLEPDMRFGYAYLEATRNALMKKGINQ